MTNDDAQLHERDWQFMLDSIYRINTTSSVEKHSTKRSLACAP